MAIFLKELFLLTLVSSGLTFPLQPLETVHYPDDPIIGPVQEDFSQPIVNDDAFLTAVNEPPPDDREEVYPGIGSQRDTSFTVVNEPPPDEVYPGTSTKRENDLIDTPVDKALREVYPVQPAPRVKRGAVIDTSYRWTVTTDGNGNNIVNIMYTIDDDLNTDAKRWLKTIFHQLNQDTCIHFLPWSGNTKTDPYYVKFQPGSGGCNSDIGHRRKIQNINLADGCQYRTTISHEIMHLLGFYHEHTRSDRDDYITVTEGNIAAGYEKEFSINNKQDNLGYPYDEHSIMQYGEHAFADPADAITMKAKDNQPLGQNSHMDAMDVNKINKLYSCARSTFVDHTIVLNTGSSLGDGTDADPFLRLIGSTGTTPYQLVTSGGLLYVDENERGASETHKLPFPDVGTISSVEITLVDKGSVPSKKRKRSFKGAQSKGGEEKRWLISTDGWTLDSLVLDGARYTGAVLYVGDSATLYPSK